MQPLVTTALMRESDTFTIDNFIDEVELMGRAGAAVYHTLTAKELTQGKVAIVCGGGNNAGDGYVAATYLAKHDVDVTVLYTKDPSSFSSTHYFSTVNSTPLPNLHVHRIEGELDLTGFDVIVDCLLGTGFTGEPRGLVASSIEAINAAKAQGATVVSVDINSGMEGNTGDGSLVVDSDLTITIGEVKLGLALPAAGAHVKDVITADIGILLAGTPFQLIDREEMDAVIASTEPTPLEAQMPFGYVTLLALANEARYAETAFLFQEGDSRAVSMTGNLFVERPAWISNQVVSMGDGE